jgi:hypothetical protein
MSIDSGKITEIEFTPKREANATRERLPGKRIGKELAFAGKSVGEASRLHSVESRA